MSDLSESLRLLFCKERQEQIAQSRSLKGLILSERAKTERANSQLCLCHWDSVSFVLDKLKMFLENTVEVHNKFSQKSFYFKRLCKQSRKEEKKSRN